VTQGSIITPVEPVVVTIEAALIQRYGGPTFTVGSESISKPGPWTIWWPIMAYDPNAFDVVNWLACIAITGSDNPFTGNQEAWSTGRITVDETNGDVFVAVNVRPSTNAIPHTVGLYDSTGALIDSDETVNNGTGAGGQQTFFAKLDQDGTPLWIKRIVQTDHTGQAGNDLYGIEATLDDRVLVRWYVNGSPEPTGGSTIVNWTYGPGDANEEIYQSYNRRIHLAVASYSKVDGSIIDLEVSDCVQNPGAVPGGYTRYLIQNYNHQRTASRVTGRFAVGTNFLFNAGFGITPQARSNTMSPAAIPSPGVETMRSPIHVYSTNPLALEHVNAVGSNGAGPIISPSYLACALDDGATAWGGCQGNGTATVTSVGEPDFLRSDFVVPNQPFFAKYASDGSVDWFKVIGATVGGGPFYLAFADDIPNDRMYFVLATGTAQTLTFGDGEAGQTAWVVPGGGNQHVAIFAVDRSTGDLIWVNTIENLNSIARPASYAMRVVDGEVRMLFLTPSANPGPEYRYNQINAPAGPTTVYPTATGRVVAVRHDAATGAFIAADNVLDMDSNISFTALDAFELLGYD
jgi:hypothetical protein